MTEYTKQSYSMEVVMAVAFSEEEKRFINDKLKEAARECLSRYGVKKTTVDQLVQMAG